MIAPARLAAFRVLSLVLQSQTTFPDALARVRESLRDPRDRSLLFEITGGVLRWQAALDCAIDGFLRHPLTDEVRTILRLSAYQLLFLDRLPASAVVSDAVSLTREAGQRSAAGLVNAVLRRIATADRHAIWPVRPALPADRATWSDADRTAALDYLSVTLSHPRWLVARWLDAHGFDATDTWAKFNNAPAPLTLRVNRRWGTRAQLQDALRDSNVEADNARYSPDAVHVRRGTPLESDAARLGWFTTQDEASQLVGSFAQALAGPRMLDACAAPGGKTLALADAMAAQDEDSSLLIAADTRARRMRVLRDTLSRAQVSNVHLVQLDLLRGLPFPAAFDLVLVDAPCSGLGTIRREPEIRWRRAESELQAFAERQRQFLAQAALAVRPGGRLVYATCSSEPEENELVTDAFLAAHPTFRPVSGLASSPAADALAPVLTPAGHLRTWPHVHGLEAFFAAAFERV